MYLIILIFKCSYRNEMRKKYTVEVEFYCGDNERKVTDLLVTPLKHK